MGLSSGKKGSMGKRGQITIFIIIAILLVAGVLIYFFVRGSFSVADLPEEFRPAYTSFSTCLQDSTASGIEILQSQGGYIYSPKFEPGSEHMPFSSHLNFLGNPIPYWYYVSGNNIPREQVPSLDEMESQLEEYIDQRITGCDLDSYYDQGFEVSFSEPSSSVSISDDKVDVSLDMNLNFARGNQSVLVRNHEVRVDSNLGNLYDSALEIYEEEQETLFLEGYAVDTLRLYAPVDGVEISCSPQTWNAEEVFDELQEGIEANTLALSSEKDTVDNYFVVDVPSPRNGQVRFINSREWPHRFEVTPSEGSILAANPVGNQPGLGTLGFCYTPYHFVYDVKYPVLVQVYSGQGLEGEVFQFPMAVVVENNNPRESLAGDAVPLAEPELCRYKNTPIEVSVTDRQGNPVDAQISYECSGNKCNIGTADSGTLSGKFPQCANGFVTANAEGFKETTVLFSTISPGSTAIIMDRIYDQPVLLKLDGKDYSGEAVIYFTSDDFSSTVFYPEQRSVSLPEGLYEVKVQIYEDSSITIPETVTEQCVEVIKPGVLGLVGFREEKCFDVEVDEQVISQALSGGGSQDYFILESELRRGNVLEINAESFTLPESVQDVQVNNLLAESSGLEIRFV